MRNNYQASNYIEKIWANINQKLRWTHPIAMIHLINQEERYPSNTYIYISVTISIFPLLFSYNNILISSLCETSGEMHQGPANNN